MSDLKNNIEHALRKARLDAKTHGHDWDVADALAAVMSVLDPPKKPKHKEQRAAARPTARKVPESCDPMHYEGDAPGFALHVKEFHGVGDIGDDLLDAWCQSQFVTINQLHNVALHAERNMKPQKQTDPWLHPYGSVYRDYRNGSTHPGCNGDSDVCPDKGCKACQGSTYDNFMRGRIKR